MSKDEFTKHFMKDQKDRKRKFEADVNQYLVEARYRMKRRYRGNLLRGVNERR